MFFVFSIIFVSLLTYFKGNYASQYNSKHPDDENIIDYPSHFVASNAKALSLRELYCRQLGNYFSAYKKLLLGGSQNSKKPLTMKHNKCTKCRNSVKLENEDVSQQSCLRKVSSLPATHYKPAFIVKGDSQTEGSLRHNRVSYDSMLNDGDTMDEASKSGSKNKITFQRQNSNRLSMKSRNIGSRLSLIFGMEDMTTDSTSILKDSRHPSISTISGSQVLIGKKTGIIKICFLFKRIILNSRN